MLLARKALAPVDRMASTAGEITASHLHRRLEVSNPNDERKLQKPDYRQKIAESLYRGIAKYVGGLSGVKLASKASPSTGE